MSIFKKIKTAFSSIMLPLAHKDDKDSLQSFAITMAIAFPLVFMGALPWLLESAIPMWPAVISLVLMLMHIFLTQALYWPYVLWMVIASLLGWINTKLILAIAYCVLIVPTGLVMKALKKLQYKTIDTDKSAWIERDKQPTKDNLKEPF